MRNLKKEISLGATFDANYEIAKMMCSGNVIYTGGANDKIEAKFIRGKKWVISRCGRVRSGVETI